VAQTKCRLVCERGGTFVVGSLQGAHHVAAVGVHLANPWCEAVERKRCTAGGCCEGEAFHR
jgi:hypothetical protein